MTEKELPEEQSVEDGEASNVPTAMSPSPSDFSTEREIKNLKALLAQQSRQITTLTNQVKELASEVKALKTA
jgi:hypothetical protein